ncbi:MAG: hypothetical protein WC446_02685 [Candidatus Paceibacterota bacterium]|jgi:hypothetical protein
MGKEQNKKTIGILNRGKNNTFLDNTFNGLDVGIQDEREGTFASDNKFAEKENQSIKPEKEKRYWFSMDNPIIYILVILLIAVICYLAHKHGLPLKFGSN